MHKSFKYCPKLDQRLGHFYFVAKVLNQIFTFSWEVRIARELIIHICTDFNIIHSKIIYLNRHIYIIQTIDNQVILTFSNTTKVNKSNKKCLDGGKNNTHVIGQWTCLDFQVVLSTMSTIRHFLILSKLHYKRS